MKKKIIIIGIPLLVCIAILITAIFVFQKPKIQCKTDVQPLINRFPNMGEIEKCVWKYGDVGSQNSRIPSTNHWLKGFIILSSEQTEQFKNEFDWNDVSHVDYAWTPSGEETVSVSELGFKEEDMHWKENEKFNEQMQPKDYPISRFYFDDQNGVIFFDIVSG